MIEIILFVFGAIIGSFLNVVIYRIPEGITMSGRSRCDKCKTPIKFYQNIPIITWLIQKGKCKTCDNKIGVQTLVVEILTAFSTLWLGYLNNYEIINIIFLIKLLIVYSLIVLSMIDNTYKAVPDIITIPTLMLSLILITNEKNLPEGLGLLFSIMGGVYSLKIIMEFLLKKEALGEADIIISGIMASLLLSINNYMLAIYMASIIILTVYVIKRYILMQKNDIYIPFIPYLSLGTAIIMTFQKEIANFL